MTIGLASPRRLQIPEVAHLRLLRALEVVVPVAVPLAAFSTGLQSLDPLWLCKRPRLLYRSLLPILVAVPVFAILLVEALAPTNLALRTGIAVSILAVGMIPPSLMRPSRAATEAGGYEVGLDAVLLVLAIIYLPVAVWLYGAVFQHELAISGFLVARVVLFEAILPFLAGVWVAKRWPRLASALNRRAPAVISVVMLAVYVLAVLTSWHTLLGLGAGAWLACAAVAIVAVTIGHLSGGPDRETKAVLAAFSAIRFPALALLLAEIVPDGEALIPIVVAYELCSVVAVAIYRAAGSRLTRASQSARA